MSLQEKEAAQVWGRNQPGEQPAGRGLPGGSCMSHFREGRSPQVFSKQLIMPFTQELELILGPHFRLFSPTWLKG